MSNELVTKETGAFVMINDWLHGDVVTGVIVLLVMTVTVGLIIYFNSRGNDEND